MSWDDIFKTLAEELGRDPQSNEVQERILEIVAEPAVAKQGGYVRS